MKEQAGPCCTEPPAGPAGRHTNCQPPLLGAPQHSHGAIEAPLRCYSPPSALPPARSPQRASPATAALLPPRPPLDSSRCSVLERGLEQGQVPDVEGGHQGAAGREGREWGVGGWVGLKPNNFLPA